jgi:hypothetical protein
MLRQFTIYRISHNFNAQLAGHKDFVLIPPSEFQKLYPFPVATPIYNFTRVNNYKPDLDSFPEVMAYQGTCKGISVVAVKPGPGHTIG